jgi:hypothetical protein
MHILEMACAASEFSSHKKDYASMFVQQVGINPSHKKHPVFMQQVKLSCNKPWVRILCSKCLFSILEFLSIKKEPLAHVRSFFSLKFSVNFLPAILARGLNKEGNFFLFR